MAYPNTELLINAIISHFKKFRDLNSKRIVGIGFLCDWKHCIEYGTAISECDWEIRDNWIKSEQFLYSLYTSEILEFDKMDYASIPVVKQIPNYPYKPNSSIDTVCTHVFSTLETRTDFDLDKIILSTYPFKYNGPIELKTIASEYTSIHGREYFNRKIA
ncbi:hypothetical protein DYI23_03325 [Roseibium polysiphoniae]|uniref:Uncharacterized protein n=1 Tax=Roseibium polysiphoniae TaxID=2571221 RepID=A0A944CB20_9HYPH|nr:hypothetical protein [Roseibium polysiphoniae]